MKNKTSHHGDLSKAFIKRQEIMIFIVVTIESPIDVLTIHILKEFCQMAEEQIYILNLSQ